MRLTSPRLLCGLSAFPLPSRMKQTSFHRTSPSHSARSAPSSLSIRVVHRRVRLGAGEDACQALYSQVIE